MTPNQRSGIRMIAKGFVPRQITVEALFARKLLRGSLHRPELNEAGRYFVRHGEYPPNHG